MDKYNKNIIIIGALIWVLSFIVWHETHHYFRDSIFDVPKNITYINCLGRFLGGGLVFLGIALKEKDINLRYLLFYPISFLFLMLFLQYGTNLLLEFIDLKFESGNILDSLLKTKTTISVINYTTLLCFLICFYKRALL